MTPEPQPRWESALTFPALPNKNLPGNPGDLINLHSPHAGLCHVPVPLCSVTSPPHGNETSGGKKNFLLSEVDTACVLV